MSLNFTSFSLPHWERFVPKPFLKQLCLLRQGNKLVEYKDADFAKNICEVTYLNCAVTIK